MITIAACLRELIAAGLTGDDLVAAVDRIEVASKPELSAGAKRQRRYRERHQASQSVTVTDVTPETVKECPLTPIENTSSYGLVEETNPSEAADAAQPVYTDSRHELWGEGKAILAQLGVPAKSAAPNIGRWLKSANDDAQTVLGAIQRARDHRVLDPIPWITQALKPGNFNGKRPYANHRTGESAILAGLARGLGCGDGGLARTADEEIPLGRVNIDGRPTGRS